MHTNYEDTKIFSHQWNTDVEDSSFPIEILFHVCRICLAVDVKMYNIGDYKLKQYYQNITGILTSQEDALPKMLCWECASRLKNANKFKDKALRSYNLLMSIVSTDILSMNNILSIDRVENRLKSSLAVKFINDIDVCPWGSAEEGDRGNDVTTDSLTTVVLKQETDEVYEAEQLPDAELTIADPICVTDPLDTTRPCRALNAWLARREMALDRSLFEVVEVPLERALADAARRAELPEYHSAPHRCDVCYKVFGTSVARDDHALRHSDVMGEFECRVCRCRWRTRKALRKHFTENHTREHICKACPFTSPHRSVAKSHQQFHKGVKFQCLQCPKEFTTRSTYLSHLRLKHLCRFPCELCGFTYTTRHGVDVHKIRKHVRDTNAELAGPYCAECDVRFATDEAHDRHLQLCSAHRRDDQRRIRNDFHTAQMAEVKIEKRRTRCMKTKPERCGSEPVRCEQCGEQCVNYRAYAIHFRHQHPGLNRTQHGGADPAMCEHCGKIFQNIFLLRAHAHVHAQSTNDTKRAHRRPRGLGVYVCPLCPKRFTEICNRTRHVATIHRGAEKRYRCETCDKRFFEWSTLRSHVDHVHLKKPWPKRVRAPRPRPATDTGQTDTPGKEDSVEV